jgi:hypothetical protein
VVEKEIGSITNTVGRHRYEIPHPDKNIMVHHEIFGIGPGPFLSLFGEEGEEIQKQNYPMFGAVMGCPDTGSVSNVVDSFESEDVRFYIYYLSFKAFYNDYFDNGENKRAFLVYLHDFSFDSWNRVKVKSLVDRLNRGGISVRKILQGDEDKIYHTVLLFEKGNDTVLD